MVPHISVSLHSADTWGDGWADDRPTRHMISKGKDRAGSQECLREALVQG